MLCAIDAEIGLPCAPTSAAEAACSAARSPPPVRSAPCPSTSQDSFSLSGTGGIDVSWMTGTFTVPVTATPASTARFLRSATMSSPGLSRGPSNTSWPRSIVSSCPNARYVPRTVRIEPLPRKPLGPVVTRTAPARRVSIPSPENVSRSPRSNVRSTTSGSSSTRIRFALGTVPALDDDVVAERRIRCREIDDRPFVGARACRQRDPPVLGDGGAFSADDKVQIGSIEHAEFFRPPGEPRDRLRAAGGEPADFAGRVEGAGARAQRQVVDDDAIVRRARGETAVREVKTVLRRVDAQTLADDGAREGGLRDGAARRDVEVHASRDDGGAADPRLQERERRNVAARRKVERRVARDAPRRQRPPRRRWRASPRPCRRALERYVAVASTASSTNRARTSSVAMPAAIVASDGPGSDERDVAALASQPSACRKGAARPRATIRRRA